MQLLKNCLVLTCCLVCAFALPQRSELANMNPEIINRFLAQVRSSMIDARALTPGEVSCANQYNNTVQHVNSMAANKANECFEAANKTIIANNQNMNTTITSIYKLLNNVQNQLHNCTEIEVDTHFLNCTTSTFDSNLQQLDEANSLAYKVIGEMSTNILQVDLTRDACINSQLASLKTNLTLAANDYSECLKNIKHQRLNQLQLN